MATNRESVAATVGEMGTPVWHHLAGSTTQSEHDIRFGNLDSDL